MLLSEATDPALQLREEPSAPNHVDNEHPIFLYQCDDAYGIVVGVRCARCEIPTDNDPAAGGQFLVAFEPIAYDEVAFFGDRAEKLRLPSCIRKLSSTYGVSRPGWRMSPSLRRCVRPSGSGMVS